MGIRQKVFCITFLFLLTHIANGYGKTNVDIELGLLPSFSRIKVDPGNSWGYNIWTYAYGVYVSWERSKFDYCLQYNRISWSRSYFGDFNNWYQTNLPSEEIRESVTCNSFYFGISHNCPGYIKYLSPYFGTGLSIDFPSVIKTGTITNLRYKYSNSYFPFSLHLSIGTKLPIVRKINIITLIDYRVFSTVISFRTCGVPISQSLRATTFYLGISYAFSKS